ncbi:UNVERIFIED_CONTAM: hypothetical protein Slati_3710500 [Sesamum latifolium]|uniref:Uncharacterized protein n=1 Tax=Sesamum latifolium TaxID=2727402 RepID=A0AAW2U2I1_9LAMI
MTKLRDPTASAATAFPSPSLRTISSLLSFASFQHLQIIADVSSTVGIQYPRSRIRNHIHFNHKYTWVGEELWTLPLPMPLSLAMHAHIICPRPQRTPNLSLALSHWGSRSASGASSGCDSCSLALLPLLASGPLAFRLGG